MGPLSSRLKSVELPVYDTDLSKKCESVPYSKPTSVAVPTVTE